MTTGNVIFNPDQASKGAFQGIKKVEGDLVSIKRQPRTTNRFTESSFNPNKPPNDQVEITLERAVILEMDEGEPEPELKEDKFVFWLNYAPPGKIKPHQNTFYVKGFLKSGVEAGIFSQKEGEELSWQGKRVTLERQEIVLFKRKGEGGVVEEVTQKNFVFAGTGGEKPADLAEHARTLVIGRNATAVRRAILLDSRTKYDKTLVDAAKEGTLAQVLGLTIDENGLFQAL